jgi:hypothetical protein
LRKIFNDGRYAENLKDGKLTSKTLRDGHPSPPASQEPYCTRSQILALYEPGGKRIAIVHLYLRTDGSIGASGKLDPKELRVGNILYICKVGNR